MGAEQNESDNSVRSFCDSCPSLGIRKYMGPHFDSALKFAWKCIPIILRNEPTVRLLPRIKLNVRDGNFVFRPCRPDRCRTQFTTPREKEERTPDSNNFWTERESLPLLESSNRHPASFAQCRSVFSWVLFHFVILKIILADGTT